MDKWRLSKVARWIIEDAETGEEISIGLFLQAAQKIGF